MWREMAGRGLGFAVLAAVVMACGEGAATGDVGPDGVADVAVSDVVDAVVDGGDVGADLAVPADLSTDLPADGPDTHLPDGCLAVVAPGAAFSLVPDAPMPQFHVDAAFDGEGIWLAYNVVGDEKKFDVWLTRIACDGSTLLAPFQVSADPGVNDTEPELTAVEGRATIAWQQDTGASPYNLRIAVNQYDAAGTPGPLSGRHLTGLAWEGELHEGNAWMPQVAALPDGGVAVTGAFGLPGYAGFQVGYQAFDADGEEAGDGLIVAPDPAVSQVYPAMSAGPDGTVYVAWTDTSVSGPDRVRRSWLLPGGTGFASHPGVPVPGDEPTASAAVHAGVDGSVLGWVGDSTGKPEVRVAAAPTTDAPPAWTAFAQSAVADHTPAVLSLPGGGVVVWHANKGGLKNDLYLQRFALADDAPVPESTPTKLNDEPAPPYQPTLVHLGGGALFVAWSEGTSQEFVLRGRFLAAE